MKQLGSKALEKIQNLIVAKQPKQNTSPKKQKSLLNFRPSTIVEDSGKKATTKPPAKSPSKSPLKQSIQTASHIPHSRVYVPRERQIKLLEKQTMRIYGEMEQRANYKVQNTHSFFLNQRNPKPPIYERAQDILRQRESYLEEKRQEKIRQKQKADESEYEEFLKLQMTKRTITKEQACSITDRLYKDYYLKNHRLNQRKINHYMEESKFYRDKPMINSTSQEIYQVVAQKNKLQPDIIDRFGQYEVQKAEKTKESIAKYKNKYTPFKPEISDYSRVLVSARDESHSLSRSKHCLSCHFIKTNPKNASPLRTPEHSTHRDGHRR